MMKRTLVCVAVLALAVVALRVWAAPVTDIDFKFDAKGDVDTWTANDPSKVEWKESGANNSAGCMKLSGSHCSADSPILSFTAADNVLSFDYFVHTADTLRMRVSVVGDDAQKKYGRYGNLFIRKPEQDKWTHVEVKLMDIPGMSDNNAAKATADLQFNRMGFMTISEPPEGSYILIDNIKLAKAGAKEAPATQKAN